MIIWFGKRSIHAVCEHFRIKLSFNIVQRWKFPFLTGIPVAYCEILGTISASMQSGCLAQLVERRPYKANVGGSNPSAPTISS
jgi:hypothetical protein